VLIDGVSKKFNGSVVLQSITAEVRPAEVLGLIGRSGSGKSVLINMLRGTPEYRPDEGRVVFNVLTCDKCDRVELPTADVKCPVCRKPMRAAELDYWAVDDDDPLRRRVRARIAIMLQRTFALFGDMTVIENIFEAMPAGMPEKAKVEKAMSLLKLVRLDHRVTHIARDLSGGEKQRCVLARQLAKNPILFLADEPTGTLDPLTADLVHEALVDSTKATGMAMVVTSHWPKAINSMASQAIWLENGKVVKAGEPKEVTSQFMSGVKTAASQRRAAGEPLVRVEGVKRYFYSYNRGVVKAVDGVSLEIGENEILGLVGPSGAGKTTLSRMISGIGEPSEGTVLMRVGDDWVNMAEPGPLGKGRATQYIGVLHQEFTLYPFDTILQNLTICIGINLPAELAKMKVIQALMGVGFERKDVERILYAFPDTLSVGEKQRVALAQVLIREPRLTVLDEPTGTMDPITKHSVALSVLEARKTLGETFLIVSHDMDFVTDCCDRAVLIDQGRVITQGEPEKVVEELAKRGADRPESGAVQ